MLSDFIKEGALYVKNTYLDKVNVRSTKALEMGSMLHHYVLRKESFFNFYRVGVRMPNAKQEDFCNQYVANLPDGLESLDLANLGYAEQIALQVGYAANSVSAQAKKLMKDEKVLARIQELIEDASDAKMPITEEELELAKKCRYEFERHPVIGEWLADDKSKIDDPSLQQINQFIEFPLQKQVLVEVQGMPIDVKLTGTADYIYVDNNDVMCVDLKFVDDIKGFQYDIVKYKWYFQMMFYRYLLEEIWSNENVSVYLWIIEKKEPFDNVLVKITIDDIIYAAQEFDTHLPSLVECFVTNSFYGVGGEKKYINKSFVKS